MKRFRKHCTYFLIKGMNKQIRMQNVKVKPYLYRSGHALRVPGSSVSQTSRKSAHEGGNVVFPTHRPPLTQKIFPVLMSVSG